MLNKNPYEMEKYVYISQLFYPPVTSPPNPFYLSSSWACFNFLAISRVARLVVFTAVTMKNGVFWDVALCGSCNNRRFGGA
jgi:hypothetical protein